MHMLLSSLEDIREWNYMISLRLVSARGNDPIFSVFASFVSARI
jgi:hypothetical protein